MEETALEKNLQELQDGACKATSALEARGLTLVDKLHDVPSRLVDIVDQGLTMGAAEALAHVAVEAGVDLSGFSPSIGRGEALAEAAERFHGAASEISCQITVREVVDRSL